MTVSSHPSPCIARLGPKVLDYLADQLSLWAKNLDVADDSGRTLSYTAADFYHDLPEEEREQIEITTHLVKQDCRNLLIQITAMTRLRSLFIEHRKEDLLPRIGRAARNCKSDDSWEGQPKWWVSASASDGFSDDARLLEALVEYGYGGILEHARGFGPSDQVGSRQTVTCQYHEAHHDRLTLLRIIFFLCRVANFH
jgi:hypothetical protein